jgi:hypothetical protein
MQFYEELHSVKVTVWYGTSAFGIMGLYFVEEGNCILTLTLEWYQIMLEVLEVDGEIWFQKDSTTVYIAWELECLRIVFPGHLILVLMILSGCLVS